MAHFTEINNGDDGNANSVNSRFQQLSDAIETLRDGSLAMASPDITSFANGAHDHSDGANGGVIPFDNLDTTGGTDGQYWAADGAGGGSWASMSGTWETGDMLAKAKTSDSSHLWLRSDGRTIGRAASGGTARANADMATLFTHLWTEFTNILTKHFRASTRWVDQ